MKIVVVVISSYFCYLGPHTKFQKPRKIYDLGEKGEGNNPNIVINHVLFAVTPIFILKLHKRHITINQDCCKHLIYIFSNILE